MEINDPGHFYYLTVYEPDHKPADYNQTLGFVKRVGPGYPGNEGRAYSGTICQEVVRALIDRVKYVNKQDPCPEDSRIIMKAREILYEFEVRAANKNGRAHLLPHLTIWFENGTLEFQPPCPICGHLGEHDHAKAS